MGLIWRLCFGVRILLWRDNKTIALTKDHKPTNEAELARIRAAGGFVDWGRVDGQLALSRAIGDVAYKENKALPLEKQRVRCNLILDR
jgi:serine/threonine protein phosphatase PrpC